MPKKPLTLVTCVAVSVLVAVAAAFVVPRGDGGWSEVEKWGRSMNASLLARDFTRPALWGQSKRGSATEQYASAIEMAAERVRDLGLVDDLWDDVVGSGRQVRDDLAARLRTDWSGAVTRLRAGARLDDARPQLDLKKGYEMTATNGRFAPRLAKMAVISAHDHAMQDQDLQAVHTLLDVAQYGVDLLHSIAIVDMSTGLSILTELFEGGCGGRLLMQLDRAALRVLASGLQRVDAQMPAMLAEHGEAALFVNWMIMSPDLIDRIVPIELASAQLWSRRAHLAEAVRAHREFAAALQREAPEEWPQRQRFMEDRLATLPQENTFFMGRSILVLEVSLRRTRAQLGMLRMAVALWQEHQPSVIKDPFGQGPLTIEEGPAGTFTIRSVGELSRVVTKH